MHLPFQPKNIPSSSMTSLGGHASETWKSIHPLWLVSSVKLHERSHTVKESHKVHDYFEYHYSKAAF